jgi:Type I restriction enzyme R protein N terminus (HSDR_N)
MIFLALTLSVLSSLPKLKFEEYPIRLRTENDSAQIFCLVRKKWLVLTPEEWVRQHVLHFLNEKKYPASLLAVEKTIELNGLKKRCDIVAYNSLAQVVLLVECKAPDVSITESVFDQAARYNLTLKADLFFLTNGLKHYCCKMNHETKAYVFLKELPDFSK